MSGLLEAIGDLSFATKAVLVAVPIGAACAMLSVFVVLRRMAFIGQGVSHAGFGGIALSALLGHWFATFDTMPARNGVTALFCIATALAIGFYARRRHVTEDTAIGILLVTTMGLGAALLNVRIFVLGDTRYQPSWESLLFGSILTVDAADVLIAYGLAILVLAAVGLLYKEFVSFAYDETMARVEGLPVRALYVLLLVLLSVTIVLALWAVGFLLVSALLIVPAATANLLSRRFNTVMLLSLLVGLLGMVGGLALNLYVRGLDLLPPGAVIVLTFFALFSTVFTITGLATLARRR